MIEFPQDITIEPVSYSDNGAINLWCIACMEYILRNAQITYNQAKQEALTHTATPYHQAEVSYRNRPPLKFQE